MRFPQIAQKWWESLEDGIMHVPGADGVDRQLQLGDVAGAVVGAIGGAGAGLVERLRDVDIQPERPVGEEGIVRPREGAPDPSTVRPGPGGIDPGLGEFLGLSPADIAAIRPGPAGAAGIGAVLGAGAGAVAGAGHGAGAEAGAHQGADAGDLNQDAAAQRIILEISEIFDRPADIAQPPVPGVFGAGEELKDDMVIIDIEEVANDAGEAEPLIRQAIDEPGERRNVVDRVRDYVNRNWPDIPDVVRNRIVNAWERWGGQNPNSRRLIGIIGAMIGTGLILRLPRGVGEQPEGPDVPVPPGPDGPDGPDGPVPPDGDCVKICPQEDGKTCECPPDDDETPTDDPPIKPDVPGDHGEHPEEMQLGDTFGLSPANYINSNDVNRRSLYPPQQGLSFDSGDYNMSNPLIRGNMMNDAIRYGGKLFMPEMPLPPPPRLTRGYVNARAPQNINELITEKPQPNTGADLHAPFNRAFQEFDIDTGKVVNDFMKSQIARLSFGC